MLCYTLLEYIYNTKYGTHQGSLDHASRSYHFRGRLLHLYVGSSGFCANNWSCGRFWFVFKGTRRNILAPASFRKGFLL